LYRLRDIATYWSKTVKKFIPHLYLAHRRGKPRRNFATVFDTRKAGMIELPCGEEGDNILSRLDRVAERDERTDKRRDGQICYVNIARQCADAQ